MGIGTFRVMCAFIVFGQVSQAQCIFPVAVERVALPKPDGNWIGRTSLDSSMEKGNHSRRPEGLESPGVEFGDCAEEQGSA